MAHKALCKFMLYKALKIPLIRPRKSLYSILMRERYKHMYNIGNQFTFADCDQDCYYNFQHMHITGTKQ